MCHKALLICGILINDIEELVYKTETYSDIENKHVDSKGQRWSDKLAVWD